MYWISAAFLLGLLGSVHCLGMCAPLFLSLPTGSQAWLGAWLYQLGRAFAYASLGAALGFLGLGIGWLQWQGPLSIALGVLLIFSAFWGSIHNPLPLPWKNLVKQALSRALPNSQSPWGQFRIGWLNGYLPCGLSYAALSGALVQGSPLQSAGFMFSFGLGTFPMLLLSFALARQGKKQTWRQKLQQIYPYAVFLLGILLVIRGLELDIPYLSPALPKAGEISNCK